jgi:hypothetical protein
MYMEMPLLKQTPIKQRIIDFIVLREKERLIGEQGAFYLEPTATSKPLTLTGGEFL